jgi:hypothetical protein
MEVVVICATLLGSLGVAFVLQKATLNFFFRNLQAHEPEQRITPKD